MNIIAITQARYGSSRLPAKILKKVNGKTLLEIHLERILKSKLISKLKIATTFEDGAEYIINIAKKLNIETFQGSIDDVFLLNGTALSAEQIYGIYIGFKLSN